MLFNNCGSQFNLLNDMRNNHIVNFIYIYIYIYKIHNTNIYIYIYIYIQSIQKRLTFVVMCLRILNIERAKNFGGNFHVNELHRLISLLVLTQDLLLKKIAYQRRSLLYGASIATK